MSKTTIEIEVANKFGARAFLSQRLLKAGLIPKRFTQNNEDAPNVITIEAVGNANISLNALASLLTEHQSVVGVKIINTLSSLSEGKTVTHEEILYQPGSI